MSTPAYVNVCDTNFYTSHDGYPQNICPELEKMIKRAKELAEKADCEELDEGRLMVMIMREEWEEHDMQGGRACYDYYITDDDKIMWSGSDGKEHEWKGLEDYESSPDY